MQFFGRDVRAGFRRRIRSVQAAEGGERHPGRENSLLKIWRRYVTMCLEKVHSEWGFSEMMLGRRQVLTMFLCQAKVFRHLL